MAHSEATCLITGDTGGVGCSIAEWLPSQGARTIVLASLSGIRQSSTRELIDELKEHRVEVVVYTCDVGEPFQVEKTVHYIRPRMPPIRGVIHGAMVIQVSHNLVQTSNTDQSCAYRTSYARKLISTTGMRYLKLGVKWPGIFATACWERNLTSSSCLHISPVS